MDSSEDVFFCVVQILSYLTFAKNLLRKFITLDGEPEPCPCAVNVVAHIARLEQFVGARRKVLALPWEGPGLSLGVVEGDLLAVFHQSKKPVEQYFVLRV